MALKFFVFDSTKPKKKSVTPFSVLYGTTAPLNDDGVNGDIYIRYNNGPELFYKKIADQWHPTGGGFSGWNSTNSQGFEKVANFTEIVPANFTIDSNSNLLVELDGMTRYKTKDYNIVDGKIVFVSEKFATENSPVYVFIGKYS